MSGKLFIGFVTAGLLVGWAMPNKSHTPAAAPAIPQANADGVSLSIDKVLTRAQNGHFYADAQVDGQTVHFLIDTGASGIALTGEDARRLGIVVLPSEVEVVAKGASGDVLGKVITLHHVAVDRKEAWDIEAIVVPEGLDVSLLGQSFLSRIGTVSINGDKMVLR